MLVVQTPRHALHPSVGPLETSRCPGAKPTPRPSPSCGPGVDTSMLARRRTTILPEMTLAEAIETTHIHRVAGLTGDPTALVTTRPWRAPTTPSSMWG